MRIWKKTSLWALALLAVLVLSASSGTGNPEKIDLEEVLSIGSFEDDILFQWVGVAVDREGDIYVTDAMDYAVKKFDSRGNLLKRSGRRGQGPGEFTAPRLLDCSEGYVFVTEQYQPVIKVFDKNLAYKFRIPLDGPAGDLKVLGNGLVAVAALSARNKSQLLFYDSKGKIVKRLGFAERSSHLLMDMVSFDVDGRGNCYLAYNFADKIVKFDHSGRRLWSRELLGIGPVKREKISSYVLPTEIVYKDIALDREGNVYVLGGEFSANRSRDIYVVDPEGKLLATMTLPESSHCITIDRNGFLYARANDGITLKKFRMKGMPPTKGRSGTGLREDVWAER